MNTPADPFEVLQSLGAGEFAHLNGSLAAHLRSTESLLKSWGARDALCRAGLFHAVYGTSAFEASLAPVADRATIAGLLGKEAEQLAYLYGACNRGAFYPRIGGPLQRRFVDRFVQQEYEIPIADLADLCELTLANELEIASQSEAFRAQHGAALLALFERMRGLVSEVGFAAACELLKA